MNKNATIYQAKNGAIYITFGGKAAKLSKSQIDDLRINVFELDSFDFDEYQEAYNLVNGIEVRYAA